MRIIILMTFFIICASNVQAQLCGQSFARFVVSDSIGNSVPNVTVELMVGLSDKDYKELWGKYGNKESGFQPNPFKIPSSVAKDLIKQNPPLSITEDHCGNPLKQTAKKSKVKKWDDARNNREGSKENFGFCTNEGNIAQYLLKISASGYVTDYYIGSYLGGCSEAWGFILTKKEKSKKPS